MKIIHYSLSVFFKAVNGPLQRRTTVLDLDLSRSMTLPADYDTNIESEWANPSEYLPRSEI